MPELTPPTDGGAVQVQLVSHATKRASPAAPLRARRSQRHGIRG